MAQGKVGRARRHAKKNLKFLKKHPEGRKKWGEIHSAEIAYKKATKKQLRNQKRTKNIYKRIKRHIKGENVITRVVVRVERRRGHVPVKRKVIRTK